MEVAWPCSKFSLFCPCRGAYAKLGNSQMTGARPFSKFSESGPATMPGLDYENSENGCNTTGFRVFRVIFPVPGPGLNSENFETCRCAAVFKVFKVAFADRVETLKT